MSERPAEDPHPAGPSKPKQIADLYDGKGAVLAGADGAPVYGAEVRRVRAGTLTEEQTRLLTDASRSDVEHGQALHGVRSIYRNRVMHVRASDILEPRRRAVSNAEHGSYDYILDDDVTGLEAGRVRLVEALAGDVWFVPLATSQLIDHAVTTMPVWHLSVDDLPAESGLVVFAEPVEYPNTEDDLDVPYWVSAISWSLIAHRDEHYAQFDDWEIHTTPTSSEWAWTPAGRHGWFVGAPVDDFGRIGVRPGNTFDAYREQSEITRRRMACLWALASTPRLLAATDHPVDRPTRRRDERQGLNSRVAIYDLRPVERQAEPQAGQTVEWSHRWIVSGHWRQQPFGPGGLQRRPTWIAPHIKGPEDQPLVLKERVAIVRPDATPRPAGPGSASPRADDTSAEDQAPAT